MKGYMYIQLCANGSYYTGSTIDLERPLAQHQNGEGANHTKKFLPITLVYYEEYQRIDNAFYREKQVQGWSRKKKEALIEGNSALLPKLAKAYRDFGKQNRWLRVPQPPFEPRRVEVSQRLNCCLGNLRQQLLGALSQQYQNNFKF